MPSEDTSFALRGKFHEQRIRAIYVYIYIFRERRNRLAQFFRFASLEAEKKMRTSKKNLCMSELSYFFVYAHNFQERTIDKKR